MTFGVMIPDTRPIGTLVTEMKRELTKDDPDLVTLDHLVYEMGETAKTLESAFIGMKQILISRGLI